MDNPSQKIIPVSYMNIHWIKPTRHRWLEAVLAADPTPWLGAEKQGTIQGPTAMTCQNYIFMEHMEHLLSWQVTVFL